MCTALSCDDTQTGLDGEDDIDIRPVEPFGQTSCLFMYICRQRMRVMEVGTMGGMFDCERKHIVSSTEKCAT